MSGEINFLPILLKLLVTFKSPYENSSVLITCGFAALFTFLIFVIWSLFPLNSENYFNFMCVNNTKDPRYYFFSPWCIYLFFLWVDEVWKDYLIPDQVCHFFYNPSVYHF